MTSNYNSIIRGYLEQLTRLLKSTPYPFNLINRNEISDKSGIYAIYENSSDLLYIGISSNLRKRILSDHIGGDRQGSAFRKNLSNDYNLKTEKGITDYILKNCFFEYMELDKPNYLEHFAVSVLKPKLNR